MKIGIGQFVTVLGRGGSSS